MRSPTLSVVTVVALAALLGACEGREKDGNECSYCDEDSECKDGMKCLPFFNSQRLETLCAKPTTRSCNPD